MTGDFFNSHAIVTWEGVAPSFFASAFTFALRNDEPSPSGYHGRNAIRSRSQALRTSSELRSPRL